MRRMIRFCCAALCCLLLPVFPASAGYGGFAFVDERFQGNFTTENLDRIIEEYELHDGWFWTTRPYVTQTFHGVEDAPGWTDSSVNVYQRPYYRKGMYGCRWECTMVLPEYRRAGRGECFGFASFIGYLLSGEYNPHGHWTRYYSLAASDGVRVGDIVRTEFEAKGIHYQHSAVVYSVSESGDDIRFLQTLNSLICVFRAVLPRKTLIKSLKNMSFLTDGIGRPVRILCRHFMVLRMHPAGRTLL